MIRRALLAIALIVACVSTAEARARYQGYCERGGNTVATAGFVSTTNVQASYPLCTYTVFITGTSTVATIYSDSAGTAKANPSTADAAGFLFFYGDDAGYDVTFAPAGVSTWTITNFGGGALAAAGCPSNAVCVNTLATGGLGTSGSPWTGWETATNLLPAYTHVHFPTGSYTQATKITMQNGWNVTGDGSADNGTAGKGPSIITSAFTSGAFEYVGLGNSGSSGRIAISNLTIYNTNGSNLGSAVFIGQAAGAQLYRVTLLGFKYGFTNSGCTNWSVIASTIALQSKIGIWVSDGVDYLPPNTDIDHSTNTAFTQDIGLIEACFFNHNTGAAAIVIENTYAISIISNKFTGASVCVYVGGSASVEVRGGTMEAQSNHPIQLTQVRWVSGNAIGFSTNVTVAQILCSQAVSGKHMINVPTNAVVSLLVEQNSWNGDASLVGGAANVNVLYGLGNVAGGTGAFLDGSPTNGGFVRNTSESGAAATIATAYGSLRTDYPRITTGANARMGTCTLNGGTPPQCVVSNTSITASTQIFLSRQSGAGLLTGAVFERNDLRSAGVSFTLQATTAADASVVNWLLIEPN